MVKSVSHIILENHYSNKTSQEQDQKLLVIDIHNYYFSKCTWYVVNIMKHNFIESFLWNSRLDLNANSLVAWHVIHYMSDFVWGPWTIPNQMAIDFLNLTLVEDRIAVIRSKETENNWVIRLTAPTDRHIFSMQSKTCIGNDLAQEWSRSAWIRPTL